MKNNTTFFCFKFLSRLNENGQIVMNNLRIVNFCLSVAALSVNGIIVFVIARNKKLHYTYNFFVLNLCISCFFMGAINQIMVGFTWDKKCCWIFKQSLLTLTLVPFLSLCLILVERYLKIFHPLHFHRYLTRKACIISVFFSWTIPVLIRVICLLLKKELGVRRIRLQLKVHAAIYVIGIMLISFVNIKTTLLVRNIQREIRDQQAATRASTSSDVNKALWFATICTIILMILYLPFCIYVFIPRRQIPRYTWYMVLSLMYFSGNIIPAFVIGFHKNIRSQLVNSLKCRSLLRFKNISLIT